MDTPASSTEVNLNDGIRADALQDGGMVAGKAGGEDVVLVRSGANFFAVQANCPHYSAPLAEGIVVGDTLRCPWHHACFRLEDGEVLRPPALAPLARWRVEQKDGKVFVREKSAAAPARVLTRPARPAALIGKASATLSEVASLVEGKESFGVTSGSSSDRPLPESIVIVGGGAAGFSAAATLRREGYRGAVTILSADDAAPYDRPNLSKDYLGGEMPAEWLPLLPDEGYGERRIELVLGVRVTSIDVANRRVILDRGEPRSYGALLLATGAEPVHLPIPGADGPRVHYLRSLRDSRAILDAAAKARRVAIIGASFIGLEVASALRMRGIEVDVAAPDRVPLERVVGRELGEVIRRIHESHGVVFHLGQSVARVDDRTVTLTDGTTLDADFVVMGVGVRPALSLAEGAGLKLDRGVAVDRYLQTSAPGIFVAGDIARWPDPHSGQNIRVEHWVVAERMGQAAARNMLGFNEPFDAVPFFWSHQYDLEFRYIGHAEAWDDVQIDGVLDEVATGGDCSLTYRQGGRILAVVTIRRDRECLQAELAMETA
jgi:NADPH-dependent 2,4-dienoyl-CoA reductase/sulfur reductase-like enzyme/nitrite reductase/ring-hydroxylating ferredoxin subunit